MYARVGMVLAGSAAVVGLALASGPGAAAEEYGGAYALDEAASFYGDDSPGLNYAYADEVSGVFDQSQFPCAEDEVLGFDARFGPDAVGCIHVDEV